VRRSAKVVHGCVWALIGCAVVIALVPFQGLIWDGKFPDVECRLKFVDGTNKPVPGVALTVLTKAGRECHFYPVDEFVPEQPVVSDTEGRMMFHHSSKFLEFAGHEYPNLIGMRFGQTSAPRYDCVFVLDGREVFRTPFNFYKREWNEFRQPTVQRAWRPPWDVTKHGPRAEEDFGAWRYRLFDANHDGVLDREEVTAANYFEWRLHEVTAGNAGERTFLVVERTIVIPNP
jgi:hypothetical protein